MESNAPCRISKVESSNDTLSSRGGLAFFVKYLRAIGILQLLLEKFPRLKKTQKGVSLENLFLQVLCFFFDGTSHHINYFDHSRKDPGYAAVIETSPEQMASSHAVKRFFKAFLSFALTPFRWVLRNKLFIWRLKLEQPAVIELTLDTMVMDNDDGLKREGCDPTYKKVKGFQPLQLIWNGKIVDAIFRRGKKHSNHGEDVILMIREVVKLIRSEYDPEAVIVLRLDSGFFDQVNFTCFDELGIGFIATGKIYPAIKEKVSSIPQGDWKSYDNDRQLWSYASFRYKCDNWKRDYRALYTRPRYDEEQELMEFARPDNIILTNLERGQKALEAMDPELQEHWLQDASIIESHHDRGADELPHRALKEFGSEQLPFKRFAANQAYYYLMLISFFLFETFKEDNLQDIMPIGSYATTVRRKLVDFAAKIVHTGREYILKVPSVVMEAMQLEILWVRCQAARPILQT
jgi:hypothetical protein